MGGVSDLALKKFLENFPNVHTINLCLDNDEAGRKACEDIIKMLEELGKANNKVYKVNVLPAKLGKDYNEMLMAEVETDGTKVKKQKEVR